jgi:integrase/recombinase XerD
VSGLARNRSGWRRSAPTTSPASCCSRRAAIAPLAPNGVAYLLAQHVATAQQHCPSFQGKRVSPHVLRHSAAMELLHSGVDCAVIALWLGHESMDTTQMYLHASLQLKQQALEKTTPVDGQPGRYQPDDDLLAFLKSL